MQKVTWLVTLVLFLGVTAMAQDTPKAEVYGGYSHLVADFSNTTFNLNGGEFGLTENVNSWFGGMVDIGAQFGTRNGFNVNSEQYLYGPVFSYRKLSSFTPSAHILLGAIRGSQGFAGISQSDTKFAAAFGGALQFKLTDMVSIRAIQADYLMSRFLSTHQNNIRLSAGIVLTFGKK
ncbi:MAG TPA: hypothetical protein VKU44_07930 [Terriglobia bacterium]|nr:hypothetical protein [Terriglobia bacterium]